MSYVRVKLALLTRPTLDVVFRAAGLVDLKVDVESFYQLGSCRDGCIKGHVRALNVKWRM